MQFIGEVVTKWVQHPGDDRLMELTQDFAFVDPAGVTWTAPTGHKINGANIPQILWTSVGSPFIGDYRRASVLHDVECDLRRHPHRKVHRMFHDAMVCDGVDPFKAKYMYQAVRLFGPKWGADRNLLRAALAAGIGFESALLNQNLELEIDELEAKLDKLLGE